jgi:hypothetical protein
MTHGIDEQQTAPRQNQSNELTPEPSREPTPEVGTRPTDTTPFDKVRADCMEYVDLYRQSKVSKTAATSNVTRLVTTFPGIAEEAARAALDTYYGMLDDYSREQEEANERGRRVHGRTETSQNTRRKDHSQSRARSQSPRSLSRSPEPKRRKVIDESAQPWLAESAAEETNLSPDLKCTLGYLREWAKDPKAVKMSIIHSAACPEFPHSEWANIIAGKAVSLDQVHSATYTTIADNRDVTKLGNIEITAENSGAPAKTVKIFGDWLTTWQKTQTAYVYVMPHRATELREYGNYITELFSAYNVNSHGKIINYDKALRTLVASRRNISLTDWHRFYGIRVAHLDNQGSGTGQASGSGAKNTEAKPKASASERRNEICRRHNAGTCPGACGRLHACSICRDTSHVKTACPKSGTKN